MCGHNEEGLTCPECKRHTCNNCFKAFKEQGFKTEECNYCGYKWFIPKKRKWPKPTKSAYRKIPGDKKKKKTKRVKGARVWPPEPTLQKRARNFNLGTTMEDVVFKATLGVGTMEDVKIKFPYSSEEKRESRLADEVKFGDLVTLDPTSMGKVLPYDYALDQRNRNQYRPQSTIDFTIDSYTKDNLSTSETVRIQFSDPDGNPASLYNATVYINGELATIQNGVEGTITFNTSLLVDGKNTIEVMTDNGVRMIKEFNAREYPGGLSYVE